MANLRSRSAAAAVALLSIIAAPEAVSQWTPSLSIDGAATVTDNVLLGPSSNREGDIILSATPAIGLARNGGRLKANARYSPSLITYVAGTRDATVRNALSANGTLEAIENFLYVDGRASIYQTFLSPFGAQPGDLGTSTTNRAEQTILGLSPYIRGRLSGGSQYQVRADFSYSTFNTTNRPDVYGNILNATWNGTQDRFFVPGVEYNYSSTQFGSQLPFVSQLGRLRLAANVDTDLQVFATGGYETNDFVLTQQDGTIYGGGFNWRPSPRTRLKASSERRYFGNSIDIEASYRTGLTAWTLNAARRAVTSQQQLPGVTSTSGIRSALDSLLAPTIPDPIEREREVERILMQSGLASSLSGPVPLYSPRVTLVESIDPSIAILGIRTTVTFNVFWRRTTPLTTSIDPSVVDVFSNLGVITQRGFGVSASHKLDPALAMDASATRSMSVGASTTSGAPDAETTQSIFRVGLTRQISPKTYGTAGLRWQILDSNVSAGYRERAVLFSVVHNFF